MIYYLFGPFKLSELFSKSQGILSFHEDKINNDDTHRIVTLIKLQKNVFTSEI